MPVDRALTEELAQLVDALRESDLSVEQEGRLESLLREDEAVRRQYIHLMGLHAILHWRASAGDRTTAEETGAADKTSTPPATTDSPPLRGDWLRRFDPRRHPFSYLSTICLLWIGYGLVLMGIFPLPQDQAESHPLGALRPPVVAQLTATRDAQWSDASESSFAGAHLRVGQALNLKAGLAEVVLNSGATVILEGPVQMRLNSRESVTLIGGKLAAQVPAAARGFNVLTPVAMVVDLGTQFGVWVDSDGATQTQVTEGRVVVHALSADGSLVSERQVGSGEAVRVTPQRVFSPEATIAQKFVTRLPRTEENYPPAGPYARQVLAAEPVLYYRLEPLEGNAIFDSATQPHHTTLRVGASSASPWCPGRIGQALHLGGAEQPAFAALTHYPHATNGEISVMAWVYAESHPQWASIAKNWGGGTGQFHLGLDNDSGRLSIYVTQPDGELARACEEASFPLGSWQHVAAVADQRELRLYRNGELVASAPCQGVTVQPETSWMSIGAKCNTAWKSEFRDTQHFWHGRIDELAVFHRAFKAEEVRRFDEIPTEKAN